MTTKPIRKTNVDEVICAGGNSFGCKFLTGEDEDKNLMAPGKHLRGKWWRGCYRCGTYLGCSLCAERIDELICLNCDKDLRPPGNWGTTQAMRKHGRIVRDKDTASSAFSIIRLRLDGKIDEKEQNKLFADLSRVSGYNFTAPGKDPSLQERSKKSRIAREQMNKTRPGMLYDWEKGEEQAEHRPEGPSDGKEKS